MTQVNAFISATKDVVSAASSAVGASSVNANLVAVAGALSGMQLSGYDVVNTQLFTSPLAQLDVQNFSASPSNSSYPYIPQQTPYQGVDNIFFDGLIDPNATLNFQDFFIATPVSIAQSDIASHFEAYLLESNSLYDPSHPDVNGNGGSSENSAQHGGASSIQSSVDAISTSSDSSSADGSNASISGLKDMQSSISQAANSAAAGINYASNNYYGHLVEPNGYIYHSSGNGDIVNGSNYADTLFGSSVGGDTLLGGSGNDIYAIYSSTTQIIEDSNGGAHDVAYIGVDNYQGTSGIEIISALNTQAYSNNAAVNGTYVAGMDSGWHINGSSDAQTLLGSYGSDILNGGGGSDTLIGGNGDDVYLYTGSETIIEQPNAGRDIIQTVASLNMPVDVEVGIAQSSASDLNITANDSGDLLIGNSSANSLTGGADNDTLVGNGGDDVYTGSGGHNTFILNSQDNYMGEITDFHSGQDHISLINDDPTITLSMAPSDGFTGVAGQVLEVGGQLQVDWNGDQQFDSVLLINDDPTLADLSIIDSSHIPHF
jgi:Ca2+-binding RTX toxin-like protein